jgi:hypothetical protein
MTTTVEGVTITGTLARAMTEVERLVSESSTFQARLGKSADGLKANHIFFGEYALPEQSLPGDEITDQPDTFVVILEEAHDWSQYGQDASPCLGSGMSILVVFLAAPRFTESASRSHLDFCNFISAVIDEAATNQIATTAEAIFFDQISLHTPPFRADLTRRESEDRFTAAYIFKSQGAS